MNEFFYSIYDLLFRSELTDGMADENLCGPIGLSMVLITVILMTLYYYVLNSVRFSKRKWWFALVAIIAVINFIIGLAVPKSILTGQIANSVEFWLFPLINAALSVVLAFVWSMIIKWGSKHGRRTPF